MDFSLIFDEDGFLVAAEEYIEKGGDIKARDNGETPLIRAAWWGNVGTARILINRDADTPLKS